MITKSSFSLSDQLLFLTTFVHLDGTIMLFSSNLKKKSKYWSINETLADDQRYSRYFVCILQIIANLWQDIMLLIEKKHRSYI